MMEMITALSPRKPKEELISHQAKVTDDYEVWEGKVKEWNLIHQSLNGKAEKESRGTLTNDEMILPKFVKYFKRSPIQGRFFILL